MAERSPHLRPRDGDRQETTPVELLFDLVYVIAVTQISHLVINHQIGLTAVAEATFLLLVVWWAWIYTTWMVNWFDPGSSRVRLILVLSGLASLLMSASLLTAFMHDSELFAGAYVALQVARNAAATLLLERDHRLRRVFERITCWSLLSAPLWLVGGLVPGPARMALWGPGLVIDLIAPAIGYWTPGLGRSATTDWQIEGGHFAERFQAFIIIALGESIAVTGQTAASRGLHTGGVLALAVSFLGTGALWWLYFGEVAEHSRQDMLKSEDPGRLGRDAYTYLHLPIVAGIIMVAVGNDFVIAQPFHTLGVGAVVMTVGGPAMYLAGDSLFRLRMIHSFSRKRLMTIAALIVLGALGAVLPAIALGCGVTALLSGLAFWEH